MIPNSAPVTLEQKPALTQQPQLPHEISLCFSVDEFDDVCARFADGHYSIDGVLREHIYRLTNGHPGLCLGILKSLKDRDVSESIYFPVV